MAFRLSDQGVKEDFQIRFRVAMGITTFFFLLVYGRVWHMQIFNGKRWKMFADANRVEIRKIPSARGRIIDRNGIVLSESRPSFDVLLSQTKLSRPLEEVLEELSKIFNWSEDARKSIAQKIARSPKHERVTLHQDTSMDHLSLFLARQVLFSGIEIEVHPARTYPFGAMASHFLGYVSEVGSEDMEKLAQSENNPYQLGDVWGVSGVERAFEPLLKGVNGAIPVVEDAFGREIESEFGEGLLPAFQAQDPVPGKDLMVTLDSNIQKVAEDGFAPYVSGALVALDPNNGDVLAMVSFPNYLPEKFSRGVSSQYWKDLSKNTFNPLYNRSMRGLYPPGSTFKVITAAAALEAGVTQEQEKIFCPGYYRLGRETKKCWNKQGHGYMNFHDAMKNSCDVYFYEMGRRLGVDRIANYARLFGLGAATGIELSPESSGHVPTESWKERVYKQKWVGGETLSVAIGQGYLQTSPLQMALVYAGIASDGKLFHPRTVLQSRNVEGTQKEHYATRKYKDITLEYKTFEALKRGLSAVVNEPGGTAYYRARIENIHVAGKTGTAQVVSLRSALRKEDHAWFVAFAPVEAPEIVVSAIVEHGGHGGTAAAPIVKNVIQAYLEGKHAK